MPPQNGCALSSSRPCVEVEADRCHQPLAERLWPAAGNGRRRAAAAPLLAAPAPRRANPAGTRPAASNSASISARAQARLVARRAARRRAARPSAAALAPASSRVSRTTSSSAGRSSGEIAQWRAPRARRISAARWRAPAPRPGRLGIAVACASAGASRAGWRAATDRACGVLLGLGQQLAGLGAVSSSCAIWRKVATCSARAALPPGGIMT